MTANEPSNDRSVGVSNSRRRTVLKLLGTALGTGAVLGTAGTAGAESGGKPKKGSVRKLGQTILEPSGGADVGPHFAEESIRSDGRYAVVGTYQGELGTFLVDIRNPRNPTEVHRVDSPSFATRHADVKFDPRDGLYYRSLEGPNTGVEVIDYGFDAGTPEEPAIVAHLDAGPTHNMDAHPEAPVLYTANEHDAPAGMSVWDVSDPAAPVHVGFAGVGQDDPDYEAADLHDVVVDPDRELAHLAFIGDQDEHFDGYQILDVSDPFDPVEAGRVDYAPLEDYTEEKLENGEPGFSNCHYANYDPERELAIVGDEIGVGVPGGKHVFDIGWGTGSPSDPVHIGFTYSPNAELMDDIPVELFDWTGHNFDVVSKGATTLLVSGDYHEGAVSYDISDPTDPTPTDQYRTDDREDEAGETLGFIGSAPMAWGVDYADERDLTVVSDMVTGLYVFRFTPDAASR